MQNFGCSIARDAARWLVALLAAPGFLAIGGKLILPRRRMLIGGRAALFLVLTLALGPGIVANTLLKDHWGRARPIDVVEFAGTDRFTPWWDPAARARTIVRSSPASRRAHSGRWRRPPWPRRNGVSSPMAPRLPSAPRSACCAWPPAHIFTDVVFAGVFMYLVVWTLHGLIFRWRASRMTDDTVERPLARTAEAIRSALAALARRRRR